ncbi:recombinase family protein [Nocardia nova]|uniref:recombinase family protein n=1 Tax=Nocardia nova TaxID=37330 RepID=UPI0027395FE3|nr:recombinase family protein [Nocardia nova]
MNFTEKAVGHRNDKALAVPFLSMASVPVSAAHGDEPLAVQVQRENGRQKAAELNSRVAREFVEFGVAVTDHHKRPVMVELLHYLDENPGIRYVIFPATGRMSRRFEDFHELMTQFDARDVVVVLPYGDPLMPAAVREALWRTTEWIRERSLAARAQRRQKAASAT